MIWIQRSMIIIDLISPDNHLTANTAPSHPRGGQGWWVGHGRHVGLVVVCGYAGVHFTNRERRMSWGVVLQGNKTLNMIGWQSVQASKLQQWFAEMNVYSANQAACFPARPTPPYRFQAAFDGLIYEANISVTWQESANEKLGLKSNILTAVTSQSLMFTSRHGLPMCIRGSGAKLMKL